MAKDTDIGENDMPYLPANHSHQSASFVAAPPPPPAISTVDSGALIIAMDNLNQDDGGGNFNLLAYGLAAELLWANIPLKWVIRTGKDKDSIDFTTQVVREFPNPAAPANLDFRAGPFVIDSAYADSARTIIASYIGNQGNVNVYRLLQNTNMDIRHILTHRPKVAVFENGGNEDIHLDFLTAAGFPFAYVDTIQASLVNFDSTSCYTFVSEPHWDSNDPADTVEVFPVRRFVLDGGNFLAQCVGIETYECFNNFQTNGCINSVNIGNETYSNADRPYLQVDGPVDNRGGSVPAFELNPGVNLLPGALIFIQETGLPEYKATARKVSAQARGGFSFYLGGHDYGTGSTDEINGIRMYMNAIFVPPTRPDSCDLDFACDLVLSSRFPEAPFAREIPQYSP